MPLKSTPERYGTVPIAIHWLSALAVIFMLASGQLLGNAADADLVARILPVHVVLGLTVGLFTLLRIVWWLAFDRHPVPPPGQPAAQAMAARLVHLGLYGAILVMVASGIGMLALTGAAPQIFGGGALPDFRAAPPSAVHGFMGRLLLLLVLGHVAAALYHQFIRRDRLLARMWPQDS